MCVGAACGLVIGGEVGDKPNHDAATAVHDADALQLRAVVNPDSADHREADSGTHVLRPLVHQCAPRVPGGDARHVEGDDQHA